MKRVISGLRRRMDQRELRLGFLEYHACIDGILRRRSLVAATLHAWMNNVLIKAFRKLEERSADKRLERQIVKDARKLQEIHLLAGGFRALDAHRVQSVRMKRILARVKLRPCVRCIEAWYDLYQEKIYALQREMASSSPAIARYGPIEPEPPGVPTRVIFCFHSRLCKKK